MSASLTPKQVASAAVLLFGQAWTEKLSRELQVSKRFVQRIAAAARDGQPYDMPEGFLADLRAYADQRAKAATEAYVQLLPLPRKPGAELQAREGNA